MAAICLSAQTLDQSKEENYALLQGASAEVGRTFLNSPLDIRFRIGNRDKMVVEPNGLVLVSGNAFKPGGGQWLQTSDKALKKEIAAIEGALEKVLQLRGVSFVWREPEQHNATDCRYMGMLAQDVEKVFPEWVKPVPSGHKGLELIGFEALVVEALRELNARCERLEAEVAQLRGPASKPKEAAPARKKKET